MRIAWINGWAIPAVWLRRQAEAVLPGDTHEIFEAGPQSLDRLEASGRWDVIAGYSLGSHLLLSESERVRALCAEVVLLAPVFGFAQEAGLGGRVARAQVRYLQRWLRTQPQEALADFYRRAGLGDCADALMPEETAVLAWGLGRLMESQSAPLLPSGWSAWVGENDSLLEAREVCACVPGVTLVKAGTHHPDLLMQAWAKQPVIL